MNEQFLAFPNIDPVALQLGPVSLHWYGIMYLLGFGFAYWLGTKRRKIQTAYGQQSKSINFFLTAFGALFLAAELAMCSFIASTAFCKIPSIYSVFGKGGCLSTAVYSV